MEDEEVEEAEAGVGEDSAEDAVVVEVTVEAGQAQEVTTREVVVAEVMTSLRPSLSPGTRWGWSWARGERPSPPSAVRAAPTARSTRTRPRVLVRRTSC